MYLLSSVSCVRTGLGSQAIRCINHPYEAMSWNNENCHKINWKKSNNSKTAQNVKKGILNNTPSTKEAQMEKLEEDWRLQLCFSFEILKFTVFVTCIVR